MLSGWTVSSVLGDSGPQAFHDPDKTALIWDGGTRSYAQLRDRALRIANALRAKGLATGDRVASLLFNRGETFELYFACAYAGLIFVPISFRLTPPEIGSILADCGAKIVFSEPELADGLVEAVRETAAPIEIVLLEAERSGDAFECFTQAARIAPPIAHDVQMILYTSGTTGRPKGVVMRSHAVMWCAMQQVSQFRDLNADAVMLLNAPMYNTAAMNESSIPTLLVGGTVAIMPSRGWSTEAFVQRVAAWGVTHTLVFPSMFRELIEADDEAVLPLQSMRWWYTGGENCPPRLMTEVRRRWPSIHLAISYGSTESGLPTMIEGAEIEARPGSVGRITPGQSIRLLDENWQEVGQDGVGEVWTAGPAVMHEYWNAQQLTAETVRDGWLKIGDLARMDEDGFYYIVGRSKDLIISKGQNIYPAEIENALRQHPNVADAAVVGLPDPEWGEVACAAVVRRAHGDADVASIMAFILPRLASYKKPRHIVFVDALPIQNGTKVDKAEVTRICALQLTLTNGGN